MNTTMTILSRLSNIDSSLTKSARNTPKKISLEREKAELKYRKFSSLTKNQQLQQMRNNIKVRNPQWKHDYYRVNKQFQIVEKEGVDSFPHNNTKYNTQFLDKTLQGGALNFTSKDNGFFTKPKDSLYSKHYRPIVTEKRKYNQDYQLRVSMFNKTWVDHKRDRIINDYTLQANPFSTARSNELICLMRPARRHRFS